VLFGHSIVSVRFQLTALLFGIRLSFWEAVLLTEAGGLLNMVPLGLGTALRATYLKRVRKLKYVDFGLGLVGSLLTEFVAAGSLGILFSLPLLRLSAAVRALFLAYILAPVGLVALVWSLRRRSRFQVSVNREPSTWLRRQFRSLVFGVDTVLKQPHMALYLLLLNLATDLVLGTRYWLVGVWLGYPVSFASGMVLQSVARATALFAMMPSGTIGLREALTGLGAVGLGQPGVSGVVISATDRIVATAWIVVMGTVSLFVLRSRIASAEPISAVAETQASE
jgi:hypothetical protein